MFNFRKNFKNLTFLIAACVVWAGCGHDQFLFETDPPDPAQYTDRAGRHDYRIKPKDLLIVKVFPSQDFGAEQGLEIEVNSNGEISLPLLGRVSVGGLTLVEAENSLAEKLNRDFIVNPSVSIRVKEYHGRTVVVLGQVKKPGAYVFPQSGRLTLMEAVALAGGFTDIAAIDRLRLIRKISGEQKVYQVNVRDIINGKRPDVEIVPGDLITVQETFF